MERACCEARVVHDTMQEGGKEGRDRGIVYPTTGPDGKRVKAIRRDRPTDFVGITTLHTDYVHKKKRPRQKNSLAKVTRRIVGPPGSVSSPDELLMRHHCKRLRARLSCLALGYSRADRGFKGINSFCVDTHEVIHEDRDQVRIAVHGQLSYTCRYVHT